MTEPAQQCIRGCARPCKCDECSDEPTHEPKPVKADPPSLMCKRCSDSLWDWLNTILDDTLHLDTRIPTDYRWDKSGGHSKISGSPALIRLGVAALTDDRSNPDVTRVTQYYEENRDDHATRSIQYRVTSWAQMFAEEQQLSSPFATMQQAVTLLQTWWTTLVTQPWVDDLYADMQDIRSALDHAHGADKPKPLGNCFTCERAIYARPGETMVRCSGCGRKYDGLAIVRLEVQRRREASA